jgi:cyclopropane-fatty-acyl-phospholipid synthase
VASLATVDHGRTREGQTGDSTITIQVRQPQFYRSVTFGGDVGAGEAYMYGFWSCNDLTALIRIIVRNRHVLDRMDRGWAWLTTPMRQLGHVLRRNTKADSRKYIAAHYDLGNPFFALVLDETMTYPCGIFERDDSTL